MDFKQSIEAFLNIYGETVKVSVGDTKYSVKALIQPMRYKNKLYLEQLRTEFGIKDGECFLYIGPSVPDIAGKESDTVISDKDRCYNVSRADRINLGGKLQYIWAVLTFRIKDGVYHEL